MDRAQRQPGRGFTLVELLVVLAVISMLMAVLTPVLNRARQSVRAVQCLSNERQMVQAALNYTTAHRGLWPAAYTLADDGRYIAWDTTTHPDGSTGPGRLWAYGGSEELKVQQCPTFHGRANALDRYTGYNYNTSYLGKGTWEVPSEPPRLAGVSQPAMTAVFGDGEYVSGANKMMRAPFGDGERGDASFSGRAAGTQGYRHLGATNVGWADGRASAHRERHLNTSEPFNLPLVGHGNGWLSPDDSLYDLR